MDYSQINKYISKFNGIYDLLYKEVLQAMNEDNVINAQEKTKLLLHRWLNNKEQDAEVDKYIINLNNDMFLVLLKLEILEHKDMANRVFNKFSDKEKENFIKSAVINEITLNMLGLTSNQKYEYNLINSNMLVK